MQCRDAITESISNVARECSPSPSRSAAADDRCLPSRFNLVQPRYDTLGSPYHVVQITLLRVVIGPHNTQGAQAHDTLVQKSTRPPDATPRFQKQVSGNRTTTHADSRNPTCALTPQDMQTPGTALQYTCFYGSFNCSRKYEDKGCNLTMRVPP